MTPGLLQEFEQWNVSVDMSADAHFNLPSWKMPRKIYANEKKIRPLFFFLPYKVKKKKGRF